jgi:hypothetical protein
MNNGNSRQVIAGGVKYDSYLAASHALGVSDTMIRKRVAEQWEGYSDCSKRKPIKIWKKPRAYKCCTGHMSVDECIEAFWEKGRMYCLCHVSRYPCGKRLCKNNPYYEQGKCADCGRDYIRFDYPRIIVETPPVCNLWGQMWDHASKALVRKWDPYEPSFNRGHRCAYKNQTDDKMMWISFEVKLYPHSTRDMTWSGCCKKYIKTGKFFVSARNVMFDIQYPRNTTKTQLLDKINPSFFQALVMATQGTNNEKA